MSKYFYIYLKEEKEINDGYILGFTISLYSLNNTLKYINLIKFQSKTYNIESEGKEIEIIYKDYFKKYNIYKNGIETDYYNKTIKNEINKFTKFNKFKFNIDEIDIIYNKNDIEIINDEELINLELFKSRINNYINNNNFNKLLNNKLNLINNLDEIKKDMDNNEKNNKLKSIDNDINNQIDNLIYNNSNIINYIKNNINKINNYNDLIILFNEYNDNNISIETFNKKYNQIILKENDNNDINDKYKYLSGFQIETLDKMIEYYKTNNKGILNLCCRMGKTRLALCFIRYMKFNKIIVFVPANVLLEQWEEKIKEIFKDEYKIIIVDTNEPNYNIDTITNKTIHICYYGNSNKFLENNNNINYDLLIFDEVHHITSIKFKPKTKEEEEKELKRENKRNIFINCLKINYKYRLSLTATLKIIDNQSKIKKVISNNDENEFGKIIDKKTFNDGIINKRLCDFNVYVYEKRSDLNNKDDDTKNNIQLENSIDTVLKIMFDENIIKKNIFFVNNINTINKCFKYIENLKNKQSKFNNLQCFIYHSKININNKEKNKILDNFKNCEYGILFAVYGLSEGFDMPYLDSVCIGEKMTTNIRITQSILRPTTYDENKPNKKASIILPCTFDLKDDKINKNYKNNKDYDKVLNVLHQLKILNINIEQHIKVDDYKIQRINNKKTINIQIIFSTKFLQKEFFKFFKKSYYTYDKAINKLKNYHFKSIEEYNNNYSKISYKLPNEPKEYYKDNNFNWYDFLSIPNDNIKKYINKFQIDNKIKNLNKFTINKYYDKLINYLHNNNIIIIDEYDKNTFINTFF